MKMFSDEMNSQILEKLENGLYSVLYRNREYSFETHCWVMIGTLKYKLDRRGDVSSVSIKRKFFIPQKINAGQFETISSIQNVLHEIVKKEKSKKNTEYIKKNEKNIRFI